MHANNLSRYFKLYPTFCTDCCMHIFVLSCHTSLQQMLDSLSSGLFIILSSASPVVIGFKGNAHMSQLPVPLTVISCAHRGRERIASSESSEINVCERVGCSYEIVRVI